MLGKLLEINEDRFCTHFAGTGRGRANHSSGQRDNGAHRIGDQFRHRQSRRPI